MLSRRTSLEYLSSEALSTRISRGCSSLNMRRAGKRFQRGFMVLENSSLLYPSLQTLFSTPSPPPTPLRPSHTPSPLPHPFTCSPPTPLHPSHTLSSLPHPFTPPTPLPHPFQNPFTSPTPPHSLSPLYSSKRANLLG